MICIITIEFLNVFPIYLIIGSTFEFKVPFLFVIVSMFSLFLTITN